MYSPILLLVGYSFLETMSEIFFNLRNTNQKKGQWNHLFSLIEESQVCLLPPHGAYMAGQELACPCSKCMWVSFPFVLIALFCTPSSFPHSKASLDIFIFSLLDPVSCLQSLFITQQWYFMLPSDSDFCLLSMIMFNVDLDYYVFGCSTYTCWMHPGPWYPTQFLMD